MARCQFCTSEWLEESSRIYRSSPTLKNKLKNLTVKICCRVRSDPDWGINEDIILGVFFEKAELKTLKIFSENEAFQEGEFLMAASPGAWKKIIRKECEFVAQLMLGKIELEMGAKVKILDLAHKIDNIFEFLTLVDPQFPDEMSEDELTSYRMKMKIIRRERGP